ncbi:hypothetical protein JCM3766R1_007104 [Sporobolomyces carnicolor]
MTGFIDYSNRKNSTSTAPSTPHGMETTSSDSEAPTKSSGAATGHLREDAPEVEQHVKVHGAREQTNALGLIDHSTRAPSSELSRSTSNGSRFREEFQSDHNDATGVERVNECEPSKPTKSGGGSTLFKRRTSSTRRKAPPALDRVTSHASSTARSQDSLHSASSRQVPTFATARARSSSSSSPSLSPAPSSPPTSPPRSPTLPSSPKSVTSILVNPNHPRKNSRTRSPSALASSSRSPAPPTIELTAQDRHYICRILNNSQFQREFSALSQIGTLSQYGDPFVPYANGPNSRPRELREQEGRGWFSFLGGSGIDKEREKEWQGFEWRDDNVVESPLCRYLYWRFIANLPALRTAKPTYWTDQIQPFIDSFAERDLSSTKERGEITKRRMLATGITRIIGSYLSSSLKPIGGPSSPARPSLAMMHRVDLLVPGNMDSMWRLLNPQAPHPEYNAWVSVVEEKTKNGVTSFRIVTRVLVVDGDPLFHVVRTWSAFQRFANSLDSLDRRNSLKLPLLPYVASSNPATRSSIQTWLRLVVIALSSPPSSLDDSEILSEARQALESFLLSSTKNEDIPKSELVEWAKRGEEQDRVDEKAHRAWVSIGRRVKSLRTIWVKYRRALIEGDELDKTMRLVKKNSLLKMFPKEYREAEEWAKIWVAYALHYVFVGSSNGSEVLNILKGFHDLIPYAAIKVGLALVNPTLAIRAIVQLVLGQPAGQQSLFQRIWSIIVGTAIKHQKKLIDAYKKKLSRATVGDVLEQHVRASYVERQKTKQTAIENDEDIVLAIMRERGSGSDIELVDRWHEEFTRAVRDGTTGSTKFEDVKNLLAAFYRLRDREQVLAIALEPNTPRLLHASIAVFYDTIYKVANASKLSERVGDIQVFLDDLIKVSLSDKNGPSDFIRLADRHHEKLYYFVHELAANGGTLLDPLLEWCKSGLEFIHSGIPPASESSTPYKRAGIDVEALVSALPSSSASSSPTLSPDAKVDPPTRERVIEEAREFATWTRYKKVYHDLCLRIDLAQAEDESQARPVFDKQRLWQEFLAQDRDAVEAQQRRERPQGERTKKRTDAGGDLEWAWWSVDELEGAAGPAKVTISLPTAASTSSNSTTTTTPTTANSSKPKGRKLSRSQSRSRKSTDEDGFDVIDRDEVPSSSGLRQRHKRGEEDEKEDDGIEIEAPSVRATRQLLPKYLEQIKAALREAKANRIK